MKRKCGDVNGDGLVNIADAYAIKEYIRTGTKCPDFSAWAADVNGDGVINEEDIALIIGGGPFHCKKDWGIDDLLLIGAIIIIAIHVIEVI